MKKKWVFSAMVLLCTTLFISHTLYVIKTHQFPVGGLDEPVYLSMAINFYDSLRQPSLESISKIVDFNKYRQPLYGVFLSIPLLLLGTSHTYKIALWMNIIFYITTIIATYFLGREFLSKKASFLAAFIFAFYGFPLFYLHFTYSETAATSFIVLTLLFLAKSNNFSKVKETIMFSFFFMLGNLVRWVVFIFVGGPLAMAFVLALIRQFFKKKRNILPTMLNALIFFLIGILPVLFLYYIPNFHFFSEYISAQRGQEISWASKWLGPQFGNLFSIQSMGFYLNVLAQQTIFFLALFVVGFIFALVFIKRYIFLVLAFIVAYGILTFSTSWKGDRFIVPIYPVMALISAITFDSVKNKRVETFLIAITLLIGSFNFLGASWGIGPMKFSIKGDRFTVPNSILVPMPIGHPRRVWLAPISWPPRSNESNAYLIVETLRKDWGNKDKPFRLLQTFEMSQVGDGLSTIFTFEQRGVNVGSHIAGIQEGRYDIFFERIKNTDYVMVKNGIFDKGYIEGNDKGWDSFIYFVRKFNKVMQQPERGLPKAFVPIKTVLIPFDKSSFIIYRKKREITEDEWRWFGESFIRIDPDRVSQITQAIDNLIKK